MENAVLPFETTERPKKIFLIIVFDKALSGLDTAEEREQLVF
jgi:hypothetical protein